MKKIVQNIPVLPIQRNFLLLSLQTGPYYYKFGKGFNKRAVGFSMTELMIAITLATLLLLTLTTIYRVAKQNYLLEQAEATIQTNANIAIGILQQELRMAGFVGCAKIGELTGRLKDVDKFFTAENSVLGSQGVGSNWQPHLPPRLYHVKPETDVISIWFRQARSYQVEQGDDGSLVNFTKNIPFELGDILLLSSCERAELLEMGCKRLDQKNCKKQDLLISKPKNLYQQAELAPLRSKGYFISQSTHLSQDGKPTYGLFRKSLNSTAHAQELVEGIEAMKISYGIKTSALAPLVFLFASQVQHWQEVYVIRIALLVTSINNVLDKPQSYQFNGKLYQANDRILRREWVTYIGLREK